MRFGLRCKDFIFDDNSILIEARHKTIQDLTEYWIGARSRAGNNWEDQPLGELDQYEGFALIEDLALTEYLNLIDDFSQQY